MSTSAHDCLRIFQRSIVDYHRTDDVNAPMHNPYAEPFYALLYQKNWIDTVQWHLEDLIRATDIQSGDLVALKRRIDASKQVIELLYYVGAVLIREIGRAHV